MATTQKQNAVGPIIEPKRDLIDQIRDETLAEIDNFLKYMNIPFDYLPDFLLNPAIYPGKIIGLKQIIERFLNVTISKYYFKIQQEKLSVKFVINTVRANLFQGDRYVKRFKNITVATRGGDDARKAIGPSRIDEPLRSLPIKNKAHRAKSKPKPKKRAPKIKTFKVYREDAKLRGSCAYCGAYIKIRHTSNFIHVNICQNPTHHHFCSKECKINWIFGLNEKTSQEE